jgi:SMP-30/Gluconolactonase/LRE-like region
MAANLANGRTFITAEAGGTPDGFRVDVDGNLWCSRGMGNEKQDGVKIFDPSGEPIGFIALPERCAHVCFGGVKGNRLFMTASHSLYSLYVNTPGKAGRLRARATLPGRRPGQRTEFSAAERRASDGALVAAQPTGSFTCAGFRLCGAAVDRGRDRRVIAR